MLVGYSVNQYKSKVGTARDRIMSKDDTSPYRLALDANCFIDAVSPGAHAHVAMQQILCAGQQGRVRLLVSLQTISELEARDDMALELARQTERLPHFAIGSWGEQVGAWNDEAGTWADGKADDVRQEQISRLAKSGNDIRDRGALIDALRADCDFFITSDGQLSKPGPRQRLALEFPIRIRTPIQFVSEFID